MDKQHAKVYFRLSVVDGYPPCDTESLNCVVEADGTFIVDNIPFYTREVAFGDVITVKKEKGRNFYAATVRESRNSLIRVVMFDGRSPAPVRSQIDSLGCETEGANVDELFSVSVPDAVAYKKVRKLLKAAAAANELDYEEAILRV